MDKKRLAFVGAHVLPAKYGGYCTLADYLSEYRSETFDLKEHNYVAVANAIDVNKVDYDVVVITPEMEASKTHFTEGIKERILQNYKWENTAEETLQGYKSVL